MDITEASPNPEISPFKGKEGVTACGSNIVITSKTPFIHYRDETIYFCQQDCLDLYKKDPLNSCMAARLLANR